MTRKKREITKLYGNINELNLNSLAHVKGYQENSHPENSHSENPHPSNTPLENSLSENFHQENPYLEYSLLCF